MSENNRKSKPHLISGIIGFILGTIFGLVVLGWWLWPVKWQVPTHLQAPAEVQQPAVTAPAAALQWFQSWPIRIAIGLAAAVIALICLAVLILIIKKKKAPIQSELPSAPTQIFDEPEQYKGLEDEATPDAAQPAEIPDWLHLSSPEAEAETDISAPVEEQTNLSDVDFADLVVEPGPFAPEDTQPSAPDLIHLEPEWSDARSAMPGDQSTTVTEIVGEETPDQTFTKFSLDIQFLPEITLKEANQLRTAGYPAMLLLFKEGSTQQGRQQIVHQTNLDPDQILGWVNAIDLLRIKGLSHDDLLILKAAGIDTLAALAGRDAQGLYQKIIYEGEGLFPSLPSQQKVVNWIEQAKRLPTVVQF